MEDVTLLESNTSRAHFALVKRVDTAETAKAADDHVRRAVAAAKFALTSSRAAILSPASLAAQLLVVLHAISVYPHHPGNAQQALDVDFALVSALHLLATSEHARELQIAHSVLGVLPCLRGQHPNRDSNSLLLLNTMRQHLSDGRRNGHGGHEWQPASKSLASARKYMALRSIVQGVPAGPDCVPALYGPVTDLLDDDDSTIKALSVEALVTLSSYREDEDHSEARATFKRLQSIASVSNATGVKGKAGLSPSKSNKSDRMHQALLKAMRIYKEAGAISVDEAAELLLSAVTKDASQWLATTAMRDLRLLAGSMGGHPAKGSEMTGWCQVMLASHPHSMAVQLEGARLIGVLHQNSQSPLEAPIRQLWEEITRHLSSKNANRKLLAVHALHALLPLQWASPSPEDTAKGVVLDEAHMQQLLDLLSDSDSSTRVAVLRLLGSIDDVILEGHIQSLKTALADPKRGEDQEQLRQRIAEVFGVQLRLPASSLDSERYASAIFSLCTSSTSERFHYSIFAVILSDLQQVLPDDATLTVSHLLNSCRKHVRDISPSITLLIATIVCKLDLGLRSSTTDIDGCLELMNHILPYIPKEVALQEAWLVAFVKLALHAEKAFAEKAVHLAAQQEASKGSSIIQQKLKQAAQLLACPQLHESRRCVGPGSLITVMDAIDTCFASLPCEARDNSDGRSDFKPLRYESYSPTTGREPRQALGEEVPADEPEVRMTRLSIGTETTPEEVDILL